LSQMAISWLLSDKRITSVVIGASRVEQIQDNLKAINSIEFTGQELSDIDAIVARKCV